jgi:hypothetical protein
VADAPIAIASEPAARRSLFRLGPLGFFVVLWIALALPYALTALWLAGPSALVGSDSDLWVEPLFRFNAISLAVTAFVATSPLHERTAIQRDFDASARRPTGCSGQRSRHC